MEKAKKGLILKTWERCRSMGSRGRKPPAAEGVATLPRLPKAKSWPRPSERGRRAPEGRLCVRVGPGKERFLIKMEHVNHPLFRTLLEEAEMEFGYANEGPLELPCEVELFHRLLWEIEQEEAARRGGCNFAGGYSGGGGYQLLLLSPRRSPAAGAAYPAMPSFGSRVSSAP